jgi:hypothetical protein
MSNFLSIEFKEDLIDWRTEQMNDCGHYRSVIQWLFYRDASGCPIFQFSRGFYSEDGSFVKSEDTTLFEITHAQHVIYGKEPTSASAPAIHLKGKFITILKPNDFDGDETGEKFTLHESIFDVEEGRFSTDLEIRIDRSRHGFGVDIFNPPALYANFIEQINRWADDAKS